MAKLTQLYPPCLVDPLANGNILDHYIAGEAVDPGKVIYFHATEGRAYLADAAVSGKHTPAGLSLQMRKNAQQSVPVVKRGQVAGYDLAALNYGALIYLDTTGDLADAANATTTVPVGRVVPTTRPNADGSLQKVLDVCFSPIVNY